MAELAEEDELEDEDEDEAAGGWAARGAARGAARVLRARRRPTSSVKRAKWCDTFPAPMRGPNGRRPKIQRARSSSTIENS
jgi:hypothetical protein